MNTVLQSSIALSTGLDLRTVAEGIETLDEWALLSRLGYKTGQGYFIAKPMPINQLLTALPALKA